jgi:cysteine synthase A
MTIIDEVIEVTTEESVEWARRCGREEGILAGLSSGSALCAAMQVAHRSENADKTIVVIIPSNGERYLSTVLFADLRDE